MIRPWTADDIEQLKPMVEDFLRVCASRGGDLADSDHNTAVFIAMGLASARRGEPTLVWDENGILLSMCLWTSIESAFEYRVKTMWALGAYSLPAARHQEIAHRMRTFAISESWRLGFDRIAGPIQTQNVRARQVFIDINAWPVSCQWEKWREAGE